MKADLRSAGRGAMLAVLSVALGMGWAALAEAKNCGGEIACACGDTLVVNTTLGAVYTISCPDVDQILHIADNVTLDCSGSTIVGNNRPNSTGFRLGSGSVVARCWVKKFKYGLEFGGWYGVIWASRTSELMDEGVHFKPGTQHNGVYDSQIEAPLEAIYFLQSHNNDIANNTLIGTPAVYAKQGSSGNYVHGNSIHGAAVLSQSGSGNVLESSNDYHNGLIRSVNGSTFPNYVGQSSNATIQNTDGSLYLY